MTPPFTDLWDWLLVIIVTGQATVLAYLRHPLWKSLLINLPLPFTLAVLATGQAFGVTHIAGFGLLLLYYHIIRIGFRTLRLSIIAAIALATSFHIGMAIGLNEILPRSEEFFWAISAFVLCTAYTLHLLYPVQMEDGYRTSLAIWIKMPAIALVVIGIVLIKGWLQGFMIGFPMVGLIAAYECRFMLGTVCRQMPILVFSIFPMALVIRLVQPYWGYQWALLPAWGVFLLVLIPVMYAQWRQLGGVDPTELEGAGDSEEALPGKFPSPRHARYNGNL